MKTTTDWMLIGVAGMVIGPILAIHGDPKALNAAIAGAVIFGIAFWLHRSKPKTVVRKRRPLTEAVKHEVWRRDQGCCTKCGSRERLEYDHIVPWSQGGSDTVRNIELLCQTCNRRKGARV